MRSFMLFIACAMIVTSPGKAADAATSAHARSLAATCASCHTSTTNATVPALTGMTEGAISQAMQAFKSGTREGTVMPQLAKGYTDAQIAAIAAWYANVKR